jgi:hypothetical protein
MNIKPSGQRKKNNFVSGSTPPRSSQSYSPRVPHWWAKENTGLKSVAVCPRCQAIYYDKHWHSWNTANRRLPKDLPVSAVLCRACAILTANKGNTRDSYSGEVILSGLKELTNRLEIIGLIKNIGKRATRRNPEAQIIKIEDQGDSVRVTTTDNQLAVALGKQVDAAVKGGKLTVVWSREDVPVRVSWTAPSVRK